ncbi:MAG TPA: type II toxin-antitoxin system VapC family toxin [Catalimonadaceae bacterium]|nr:type II toxin-antitoxin system VapC family toxin [Catalimonadaceae bacterium]HPI11860.1 type II toxin-antitoxin system VapC family toxin [Catalimonadaceae bacterium]
MAKNKVICDTDVMIDYWDTSSPRHADTKDIIENKIGLDQVVISAITKMELLAGAVNKGEETKINKMVRRFNIALINNEITIEALQLFEAYRLSHGLAIPDCFIGATAKTIGIELFTYNTKDFRFIAKLKLFSVL